MSAPVRRVVKAENGYRMVHRAGLVWLIRPAGTVLYCSTYRPVSPDHAVAVGVALFTLSEIDAGGMVP